MILSIIMLSCYHVIILSYYHVIILSYCHIIVLSYYHLIILYYITILSCYHYYSPTIFGTPKKDPSQYVLRPPLGSDRAIELYLRGGMAAKARGRRVRRPRVGWEAGFSNGFIVEENCLSGYKWCIIYKGIVMANGK